ncbi:MAG TPA: HoxN/HupN/NixA family nickel/cobalt transporter [Xanthobacteraceae bacterium]
MPKVPMPSQFLPSVLLRAFDDGATSLRGRILSIYGLLIAVNVAAWAWALSAFHDYPVLLGTAFLAYGFGLRHAVDADHIAAIDNVTRKLMQEGKRPVAAGFFFSLGHSTVVVLASIGVAVAAAAFKDQLEDYHSIGGVIGTSVSAAFLLLIATINVVVLANVYRTFRRVKNGNAVADEELNLMMAGGGLFARACRSLFRLIGASWHMYPLGFLFGLGFDTATEVGLLGISAAEASNGLSMWSILVFPALFTAGMTLIDTTDSILMVGAYGWAFVKPIRKLYYNMTITFVSVIVAVIVGGVEALGLVADKLGLQGGLWDAVASLNDNFGALGYLIIGIFAASWIVSVLIYRFKGYDRLEMQVANDE